MSYIQRVIDYAATKPKPDNAETEIELKFLIDIRNKAPGFVKIPGKYQERRTARSVVMNAMYDKINKIISRITSVKGAQVSTKETINFIQRSKINLVKQLVFKKGVQQKEKKNFYQKEAVTMPIYLTHKDTNKIPVKFSISEELIRDEFHVNHDIIRCRLRLEIIMPKEYVALSNWRIDITLSKTLDKVSSVAEIKSAKNTLFTSSSSPDNFIPEELRSFVDSVEFEVEALDSSAVSEKSINDMMEELSTLLYSDDKTNNDPNNSKNSEKYYQILGELAQMLDPRNVPKYKPDKYGNPPTKSFKNLGSRILEMSRTMYYEEVRPDKSNYFITDKADGQRVFLYLYPKQGKGWVVTSKGLIDLVIPKADMKMCFYDAEMLVENNGIYGAGDMFSAHDGAAEKKVDELFEVSKTKFIIFDVMVHDGHYLYTQPFEKREDYIKPASKLSEQFYPSKFYDCTEFESYQKCIRKFEKKHMKGKMPFPYETDGYIFTRKGDAYKFNKHYKLKPPEHTTIDFLVKKCPKKLLGIAPYINKPGKNLYILFVGIDQRMRKALALTPIKYYRDLFPQLPNRNYVPIQFSPSSRPTAYLFWNESEELDSTILELLWNMDKSEWKLVRERKDKKADAENNIAYGNDYRIAESVWQKYFDPITKEDLQLKKHEGDPSGPYFQKHDVAAYKAMRAFNSYVKTKIMRNYSDVDWVIDIGSGKGQDLFRYFKLDVKNVLFIDIDSFALNILISRKLRFTNPHIEPDDFPETSLNITTLLADVNQDYEKTIDDIKDNGINVPHKGVPLIVCNFAIHYFVGTTAQRKNFVKLVSSLLAPGGHFIYTTMSGEKVFDLLKADGVWDRSEPVRSSAEDGRQTQTSAESPNARNAMDGSSFELKYSIRREYRGKKFTGNKQKIRIMHPFSNGEYYEEYLVNKDLLDKEFARNKMDPEIHEGFGSLLDSNEITHVTSKLTKLDKEYISLFEMGSYYKRD